MSKNLQRFALGLAILGFGFLWHSTSTALSSTVSPIRAIPEHDDASSLYDKKCADCHGKDGRARSFRGKHTHARDLTDAQWQEQVTDERIYNSISNGKGKMPAFSKKLSEADMNSLVTFVRGLRK
jgi:cytochrome c553